MKNYTVMIYTDTLEVYEYLVDDAFDEDEAVRRAGRSFHFSGSDYNKTVREIVVRERKKRH